MESVGLKPDPLCVKLVSARMADRGREELERLPSGIASLPKLQNACAYHLGVGASFTEFLLGGVPLKREFKSEIASLGAIAHTIFALFDALLDSSQGVPVLFGDNPQIASDPDVRAKQELVIKLVDRYFKTVNVLSSGAPRVRSLLESAIRRLYEAELQSAVAQPIRPTTWWRKNALPIVVMGLPAWLSNCQGGKMTLPANLLWLGRVGEFLGWLDDFADYETDRASGQANRLLLDRETSIEERARKVAHKGRGVLLAWDARNNVSPLRDTFTVIVWTWMADPKSDSVHHPSSACHASG
jgi:hypothetical protein